MPLPSVKHKAMSIVVLLSIWLGLKNKTKKCKPLLQEFFGLAQFHLRYELRHILMCLVLDSFIDTQLIYMLKSGQNMT